MHAYVERGRLERNTHVAAAAAAVVVVVVATQRKKYTRTRI